MIMARYVESRLVATQQVDNPNVKGETIGKNGEWVATSEVNKPSRRQAMRHFSKDDPEGVIVQRRVRQDDETQIA
jgi:hypothetical protein